MFGASVRDGAVADKVNLTRVETPLALHPIDEGHGVITNSTAQWNLDAIILMGLVGNNMPSVNEIVKNNPL